MYEVWSITKRSDVDDEFLEMKTDDISKAQNHARFLNSRETYKKAYLTEIRVYADEYNYDTIGF